jgi:hypothetical protein
VRANYYTVARIESEFSCCYACSGRWVVRGWCTLVMNAQGKDVYNTCISEGGVHVYRLLNVTFKLAFGGGGGEC